mmetsp:Transcript_118652/g.287988  ORF Transcript_118652/g.287988 Transcript_118652/m.287988 type:complete len:430 (-) Transcript_118652:148-1437(-)
MHAMPAPAPDGTVRPPAPARSALRRAPDVGGQDLGHHLEGAGDRRGVLLREVPAVTPGGDHLPDPAVDDRHVGLLEPPHGDHDHVEVGRHARVQHLADLLAPGVLPAAAEVVAVGEADEPPRGVRGGEAGLAQELEALGHGVEEAGPAERLRLEARDPGADLVPAQAYGRGQDDRLDRGAEAHDAHEVVVLHLVHHNPLYTSHARGKPGERRARVLREHGEAPVQAKNDNLWGADHARAHFGRGGPRHGERGPRDGGRRPHDGHALARWIRQTPAGRGLHGPTQVAGLGGHLGGPEARDAGEGCVQLLHAHPPEALADVDQALAALGVLEGLRVPAEDLLAELVDAHPAVVQGRRPPDALRGLPVAPGDDALDGLQPRPVRQGAVLGLHPGVVGRAEHHAELAPAILPSSPPQVLRPVPLRGGHSRGDQ